LRKRFDEKLIGVAGLAVSDKSRSYERVMSNDLSGFSFNGISEGEIRARTKSAAAASPQQHVEPKLLPATSLPGSGRRTALSR
jgi:hypothetical protein